MLYPFNKCMYWWLVGKHHLQQTCMSSYVAFNSHNICGSHEKKMSAQEYYHFTLNGLETFDWQPTPSGVRSDLREKKGDGGALYVHAAHLLSLNCHMVSWAGWSQPVKKLHGHLSALQPNGSNQTDHRIIHDHHSAMLTCAYCTQIAVVTPWLCAVI